MLVFTCLGTICTIVCLFYLYTGGLIVFMVSCTYSALLKNIDARVAELHEAGQWRVLNPGDVRENVGNKGDNSKIKGKMFVLRKN